MKLFLKLLAMSTCILTTAHAYELPITEKGYSQSCIEEISGGLSDNTKAYGSLTCEEALNLARKKCKMGFEDGEAWQREEKCAIREMFSFYRPKHPAQSQFIVSTTKYDQDASYHAECLK